jgi:hypothetical protein
LQLGFDNLKLRGLEGAIIEVGHVHRDEGLRGDGGGGGREGRGKKETSSLDVACQPSMA